MVQQGPTRSKLLELALCLTLGLIEELAATPDNASRPKLTTLDLSFSLSRHHDRVLVILIFALRSELRKQEM